MKCRCLTGNGPLHYVPRLTCLVSIGGSFTVLILLLNTWH
jgi:hypothetical protein